RAYIEVELADTSRVQEALEAMPGVAWARVNAALGRVVVQFSGEPPPIERLVEVVDAVERERGAGRPCGRSLPGDAEPLLRSAVELGTDACALAAGVLMRALRFKVGSTALSFAALTSLLEFTPGLRERVEQQVGPRRARLGLHAGYGLSQALIQAVTGPVVDAVGRSLRIREHVAHGDAWVGAEARLASEPDCHDCAAPIGDARPGPLRPGPVERYTGQALAAMVGAFGFSLVASRSLVGASAAVFGVLPRPALAGREAFVADLGRTLADHGVVVMDPDALRVLDRI